MRCSMQLSVRDAGLGRNSCQLPGLFCAVLSKVNSMRGDGAIVSKKRQEGIIAGKSNFNVCSMYQTQHEQMG